MKQTCGIYKITSPHGLIYIGQSCDINNRWKQYRSGQAIGQHRLIKSFIRHGVKNHKFEIIEECDYYDLNIRESHYIKLYNSTEIRVGLNIKNGHITTKHFKLKDSVYKQKKETYKLTEIYRLRINTILGKQLSDLPKHGIKPSKFIRQAIAEKIERDVPKLLAEEKRKQNLIKLPF